MKKSHTTKKAIDKAERRERKKRSRMKVTGRGVFNLQKQMRKKK